MGLNLRGFILFNSGSFSLQFVGEDKNAVLMHFSANNSNSTKIVLVVYDLYGSNNHIDWILKQNKGLSSFTLERYPCITKIFLIRCGCRNIKKMSKIKLLSAFTWLVKTLIFVLPTKKRLVISF